MIKPKDQLIQLKVKTILNRIQPFTGFVYDDIRLVGAGRSERIEITVQAHEGIKGKCSQCRTPRPGL